MYIFFLILIHGVLHLCWNIRIVFGYDSHCPLIWSQSRSHPLHSFSAWTSERRSFSLLLEITCQLKDDVKLGLHMRSKSRWIINKPYGWCSSIKGAFGFDVNVFTVAQKHTSICFMSFFGTELLINDSKTQKLAFLTRWENDLRMNKVRNDKKTHFYSEYLPLLQIAFPQSPGIQRHWKMTWMHFKLRFVHLVMKHTSKWTADRRNERGRVSSLVAVAVYNQYLI